VFNESTLSGGAKSANEGFVWIATVILSAEILALGLAGWPNRYPAAHDKAQALLAEHVPGSRARLAARYLSSLRAEGGTTKAVPAGTRTSPIDRAATLQAITDAGLRYEQLRLARIDFELLSQLPHQHP
jgi:hypothetical protein